MTPEPIDFLVVDDVEENLVALEALLRRPGLRVLKARSGAEALELLLVSDVALALLDVQMPGMDGFELAELMRGAERTKAIPIIFLTAGARDPQRVFQGYEAGAVDFLFKPIDPHALRSKADVFFELHRQRRELSNALRLNEMFVGILGHDLRNPLSTIMTGARLLERQLTDEKQLRNIARMTGAGQRMTDMIDQLLDLTRARLAGGLGFARARQRVDLAALVQRTVEELRGAHPGREVRMEVSGDSSTMGDPDRLLQLFSNLVANALHHGQPDGKVRVRIEEGERELVVRVSNAGVIPPELRPGLFDPFRKRERGPGSRGLGLGLYISRQIARAHGGDVEVESTEEAGTTLTVRLPRRARAAAAGRDGQGGPPWRILVVDDDADIVASLRDAFSEEGYDVVSAANGREALDLLLQGETRPDVVILDLVLPVLDGQHVYQAMRADPALADIPVIVSTSSPARAPTGAIVMAKPVELGRLLDAVNALREQGAR